MLFPVVSARMVMSQCDCNPLLDDDSHSGVAGVAMAEASSCEDCLGDLHLDECRAGPAEEDGHARGEENAAAKAEHPPMSPSGDGGMGSTTVPVVNTEGTQQRTSATLRGQPLACCDALVSIRCVNLEPLSPRAPLPVLHAIHSTRPDPIPRSSCTFSSLSCRLARNHRRPVCLRRLRQRRSLRIQQYCRRFSRAQSFLTRSNNACVAARCDGQVEQ